MQANSQHSGQLQNLHGKGAAPGDWTGQNFYQLCLPPHTANPSYPGQSATGNYFTCTIQPATSDQILTSSVQATNDKNLAQENMLNSKHALPTGNQDSQMILWNMPSNCQIFLPISNINLQGAPNSNGPNMSHCAFNSTNSLYMQQQTTSSAVGPHNSQQFKTVDTTSLNEARRNVNTSNLYSRQQHANAPTNLPKDSSETRPSLPSDLKYYPLTENARHGQSSLIGGYPYQLLIAEMSNANVKTLPTCVQNLQPNNAAQRAVAVVTPLSPIGTAPVNVSDKSVNMKMNVTPVQETVHHQPNIPHLLVANANLKNQTREPNNPTSKHERPKSAEPRLNDGLCNVVGAKSPVLADESTGQSCCASSPKLKSVVAEQKKSVQTQMQNELAEKTNKNYTITDKKTVEPDTVHFIEWPLDRLQALMTVIQQMEDGDQKNIHEIDPWRDILKIYWNEDFHKFFEAVQSGIYQSIMKEVFVYCPMKEPVILRQTVNDARSKVIENFHVLKQNEEPPKMTYKSSWLNLNENVDDIDKECGHSWFYKSFQNVSEHEAQNLACETPSELQEATEKPSSIRCKQLPSEVENKVPADKPTSNNESLYENVPVSFNGQSASVTDINCSPKHNCQVTEVTNSQPIITNSLEAMITVVKDLDKQGVPTGTSNLDDQFCNDVGAKSVVSPKSTGQSDCKNSPKPIYVVTEEQVMVLSSQMQVGFSEKMHNNGCAVLNKNVRCETLPKQSQELRMHMNEEETEKMYASATKLIEYKVIAALLDKHKASLLNTPQELDTISTEERTSRQRLEAKTKYPASTFLRTLLSAPYKPSLAKRKQGAMEITDKVQQEEHMSSEKSRYDERCEKSSVLLNALSPPVIDHFSPKLNEQQTSCQPNTVNLLKGMTNLVRTLEKRDVSLKHQNFIEKHGGLKRKHKQLSRTSKLDKSFCNRVGAKSPILIDESSSQSDCSSPLTLSPVVENWEFVPLTQAQNESSKMMPNSDFDKAVRYETDPKPCQELSVQTNEEKIVEMDASSSVKLIVLTQEVAKQYFAENKDIAASPKTATLRLDDPVCNQAKSPAIYYASPTKLYPVLAEPSQMQNESDEEMPEIVCVLSGESVRCETDPKPSQELPVQMNEEEVVEMDASTSIRIHVLSHKVAMQCFAGPLMQDEDTATPPVVVKQTYCQSNIVHPLNTMTHLVKAVGKHQHQTGKSDLLKNKHQTSTATSRLNEHFCNGDNQSGSVSPIGYASPPTLHPVLAEPSQVQSDEEMPEIDCVLTDKNVRCDTDPKHSQELTVQINEEVIVKLDTSACMKINVLPHEVAKRCFAGQIMENKDIAAPPETIHKACLLNSPHDTVSTKEQINMGRLEETDGAESPGLTDGSTSQSISESPPKLCPVIAEPSQIQIKSNEEMPEIDCMLTDERVRCETDPEPSQERPVNMNEEETAKIDRLNSIKVNVLPHEMAELWFAGEMEDKDLQKDIALHIATEDEVNVQVPELKSEKEVLLKDVKPKEWKYQSSGGEKVESYCCLAKWFQTLEYGNGSVCMCQIKAELREKEIKTEAHSTSLEVQTKKDSPGECERVEMDNAGLERTDDSEITDDSEDENPLLHDPSTDKAKIAKDISSFEEVCKVETETSEQKINESPTECAANVTLMNEIKQDTPAPNLKRKTNTVCLALYGSSSEKRNKLKRTKRYKEKVSCEEPPKTVQVIISSHQEIKDESESKKRRCVETQDEDAMDRQERIRRAILQNMAQHKIFPLRPIFGLGKNGLSSTSVRKLFSPNAVVKSDHLAEGNMQKRQCKNATQMSMNKYIIRGKTVPSKLFNSPENVRKSKYELGNPVLMPLDESPALEFKVLPKSFNFEDEAELNCAQGDVSQSTQNGMSGPEEKAKRMKTSHVPTQGVWSFSPLKKKHTQFIQSTNVSGLCSLFQEFKNKYQERKKDIASKQEIFLLK
ncbi:uncharacterized protein LOC107696289 [Sinocyclocheilus anshuiensis]|uniref:uncharacterized protein LOC107696289 n=1 Tax=Sinocyclocheilus anshuiensis TaxID=1608454 RepID=UPI0007B7BE8F|nr:PREDICTED: uncharacterized protein LOC107696289 [Sinocyclocheilus anshuiensis]